MPVRSPAAPTPSSTSSLLIAFGNQMRDQMDKTGNSISQWFDGARKAASNSANKINSGSNPA